VFINTKDMGERLAVWLRANGFNAAVLSGDVPQPQRLRLLQDFTEGRLPILVATDVAARGLHIPDVSHVFNFDLPQNAEDYVHRIGRTARAGASGDAVSFACERYVFGLPDIEAYIGHKIPTAAVTPELLPTLVTPARSEFPPREERHGRDRGARTDRGGRRERGVRREERGRPGPAAGIAARAPSPRPEAAAEPEQVTRESRREEIRREPPPARKPSALRRFRTPETPAVG
jgi:ATP-dependent RNA helicase RhlB